MPSRGTLGKTGASPRVVHEHHPQALTQEVTMDIAVAVGQFATGFDVQRNLDYIASFIDEAHEDELVVLPEGAVSGYSDDATFIHRIDQQQLDAALQVIESLVSKRKIHLMVGVCRQEGGAWYNEAHYYAPAGRAFIYRKVNLATHERGVFTAGDSLPVFPLQMQRTQVRASIQLCREIRFPDQWQRLAEQGADLFIYLTHAINPQERLAVWRSHLISRAAENQRFVLSANVAHVQQHCPSMIISPRGDVLAESAPTDVALVRGVLHLAEVSDWYLSQRRTDLVP
jgi:predicted amidohydrolase